MKTRLSVAVRLMLFFAAAGASSQGMAADVLSSGSLNASQTLELQAARLDALEAELAAMRQHTTQTSVSSANTSVSVYYPSRQYQQGGFVGGAEIALLKAHVGEYSLSLNGSPFAQITPEFDFDPSYRFWAGYETASGLGFRARYWNFDHTAQGAADLGVVVLEGVDAQTIDVEVYQEGWFCRWEWEVAGGIRWARLESECLGRAGPVDVFSHGTHSEGVGPTFAVAARRPIACTGLALVAGFRASLLFGDSDFFLREDLIGILDPLLVDADSEFFEIYEIRVGTEYSRPIGGGGRLFGQAVLEAQSWEVNGLFGTNVGFIGPAFSLGLER